MSFIVLFHVVFHSYHYVSLVLPSILDFTDILIIPLYTNNGQIFLIICYLLNTKFSTLPP